MSTWMVLKPVHFSLSEVLGCFSAIVYCNGLRFLFYIFKIYFATRQRYFYLKQVQANRSDMERAISWMV